MTPLRLTPFDQLIAAADRALRTLAADPQATRANPAGALPAHVAAAPLSEPERREAAALVGLPMVEAYPGIDQTPLFGILRECMEQRTSRVIENHFTFPDGSTQWFELRIRPVPAGICIYSADIEARKRPQSFGQRIRKLFR